MQFLPFQVRWLADQSALKVMNKARRAGGTEVALNERAFRAAGIEMLPGQAPRIYDPRNVSPNLRNLDLLPAPQLLFSATHTQAKDLLARSEPHLLIANEIRGGGMIQDIGKELVTLRIGEHAVNLRAFSTSSSAARSFEGDLLFDEFAHVRDQEKLMTAALAMAGGNKRRPEGYRVAVISTPMGDDNVFHGICKGREHEDQGWSYHEITIHTALAEGHIIIDPRTKLPVTAEDLRRRYGEDAFQQEFECSFLASSQRYIPRDMWEAACDVAIPDTRGSGVYGGMDVGAGGHESVIVDLERNDDVLCQLIDAERRRERDWDVQEKWAGSGMQRRTRFALDASGIGDQFGQRMEHAFPGVAESVKFTLQSKEELATGLKLALSRKKLRPLASDTQLMRDVLMLRRTVTAVGNVRYDANETKQGHADGAWALALAVYAAGGAAKERAVTTRISAPKPTEISGPRQKRGAWR